VSIFGSLILGQFSTSILDTWALTALQLRGQAYSDAGTDGSWEIRAGGVGRGKEGP